MITPYDFIESINSKVDRYVGQLEEVTPQDLGLDKRTAYRLYVDKDRTCIVVNLIGDDRTLQYYGGFEYVDRLYRNELGDWVFYMAEDDRVSECLAQLSEGE